MCVCRCLDGRGPAAGGAGGPLRGVGPGLGGGGGGEHGHRHAEQQDLQVQRHHGAVGEAAGPHHSQDWTRLLHQDQVGFRIMNMVI